MKALLDLDLLPFHSKPVEMTCQMGVVTSDSWVFGDVFVPRYALLGTPGLGCTDCRSFSIATLRGLLEDTSERHSPDRRGKVSEVTPKPLVDH